MTAENKLKVHGYDKVVYLLQGGGSLGAYQVGVCSALLEKGCDPNWVVGTSIGAINSSIIVGNKPEDRIEKLKGFWNTVTSPYIPAMLPFQNHYMAQVYIKWFSSLCTLLFGQPGFFKPRPYNQLIFPNFTSQLSFYDTSELRDTLIEFINFDIINQKKIRLTLASVCVEDNELEYFDNTKQTIEPEHVMASGALPPGFPAIRIGNKDYWDGGLSSNTPFNIVLSERLEANLLCILVNLFAYHQNPPMLLTDVIKRKKDIEFSSRYHHILKYLCDQQSLRNEIYHLFKELEKVNHKAKLSPLAEHAHPTTLNIVRFHYRDSPSNLWTKDFEFSSQSIKELFDRGYHDVQMALQKPDWLKSKPNQRGVKLHEF